MLLLNQSNIFADIAVKNTCDFFNTKYQ